MERIYGVARSRFREIDLAGRKVRLLGVTGSGLMKGSAQFSLFEDDKRLERMAEAIERIKEKFGDDAVGRARLM